jgi:hypothetical protein
MSGLRGQRRERPVTIINWLSATLAVTPPRSLHMEHGLPVPAGLVLPFPGQSVVVIGIPQWGQIEKCFFALFSILFALPRLKTEN